jgi:hypothetical protein
MQVNRWVQVHGWMWVQPERMVGMERMRVYPGMPRVRPPLMDRTSRMMKAWVSCHHRSGNAAWTWRCSLGCASHKTRRCNRTDSYTGDEQLAEHMKPLVATSTTHDNLLSHGGTKLTAWGIPCSGGKIPSRPTCYSNSAAEAFPAFPFRMLPSNSVSS